MVAFGIPNAGVLSFVRLSVLDGPLSEAGRRSGATGLGGVVSIVRLSAGETPDVFPAESVKVPITDHVPSANLPNVHAVDVGDTT